RRGAGRRRSARPSTGPYVRRAPVSSSGLASARTPRGGWCSRSPFSAGAFGRARLLLRSLDRFAQGGHEIHDLASFFLLGLGQRLALCLCPDEVEELLPVDVVVLGRVERLTEVLDEGLRHVDLRLLQLCLAEVAVQRVRTSHLVRVVHRLEKE